ncbi:putative OmpL-like beta-barrel porin-2 [Aquimarina sp. MAR_2010_214]|uniref:porin n=1 Tax=Aquimarina sp. MAR_2010_214 TaxID=1250026 RepID=UPI000C6FDCA1|nr:porin [Aquimarina sp. MAR_2010_214]PKV52362.1 putative OmpL-like beta-barrel porin-2 [Aquimarina sp. MAR_2010_214]
MKTKTTTFFLRKVTFFTLIFLSFKAICQGEIPKPTLDKLLSQINLSGSIDGYYRYNIVVPNDNSVAPKTSFVNQSGFALGMANVILGYEDEKVGFVADLVFGSRGEDAVFNSNDSAQIINQLYLYWNVIKSIKLTFGKFNTFIGYEVISPTGNFNYSTSYMFSYGPFSHTGLKADFAISEKWSAMLAVMNPSDYTDSNPFDTYIAGAQIGYALDNGSVFLNFRYGNEGEPGEVDPTFQVDLTTGWDLTQDFYFGVNTAYVSIESQKNGDTSGFYGVALYPQYKTSQKLTIGIRGEYFSVYNSGLTDVIGLDAQGDGDAIAITLTGNYNIGKLTLKPELRIDTTSEDFFIDNDREPTKNLSSFVFGAIYKF